MSEKDLLNQLIVSDSIALKLNIVKKIRNSVIGNRKRKKLFLSNQAIQILTEIWLQNSNDIELVSELATIIGSLTLGDEEAVSTLIQDGGIDLLFKGLCSSNIVIIASCLKAIRSVYSVDTTPHHLIYQDNSVARKLVAMLLYPSPLNESAATILYKTCQTQDHQNFLFANGIVSNLFALIVSPSPKVVSAGILCLTAVIKENSFTSSACVDCMVPGSCDIVCIRSGDNEDGSLIALLVNLMTYSSSNDVKLSVCICVAQLYKSSAISSDDPVLTLKLIPCLVNLCKSGIEDSIRISAANSICDLVSDNISLQEMAASTDCLLSVLSEFFLHKPTDENEDADEKSLFEYYSLCQSALQLLASLSSSIEDIRFQVITKSKVMQHISDAIESDVVDVKIAATKCLLSLSRSPKLLRTYLSDAEVWRSVTLMLSSTDDECIKVSSSLACNLLHSFCPSREAMVIDGIIPTLSRLTSHSNPFIQLNAVWALMNCSRDGSQAIINQIRTSLSIDHIILILQSQQSNEPLVVKCLGLLMNLTQSSQNSDSILEECHGLVQILGSVMALSLSDEVYEQVLCILVNFSNGSSRSRDRVAECETITKCLAQLLRTNHSSNVLVACCKLLHNLSDISQNGHTHRQNCIEEAGIQHFLQKLEMTNNSQLQEMVRQVLELLQTASL